LVSTKQLGQPPAPVIELAQIAHDHVLDLARLK
jgi:hypothetical protein